MGNAIELPLPVLLLLAGLALIGVGALELGCWVWVVGRFKRRRDESSNRS